MIDALVSCLVAALIFRLLPETKPRAKVETQHAGKPESIWQTVLGYRVALRDFAFMAFIVASIMMLIVYQQAYGSLSVFLRDVHGISTQGYGFLMTSSAITVVLFQFGISRWLRGRPPFLMMALGTLFYMVGFTMFGLVSPYILFVACIVIITIGEMIVVPVSQGSLPTLPLRICAGGTWRYLACPGLSPRLSVLGWRAISWITSTRTCFGTLAEFYALSPHSAIWILHLKLGKRERFIAKPAEAAD